ncbi:MAG: hypothetical protein AB8G77_08275 [Rhodothermales bacterium]
MKSCILSVILLFSLAGCDLFNLSDETDVVSGRWTSNVVPQAGNCCLLDLTLDSNKGDVIGNGLVGAPGQRVGASDDFVIEVSGTVIGDRINLSLNSEYNPGSIEGNVIRGFNGTTDTVIRVNFSGFGVSGRDIILIRR